MFYIVQILIYFIFLIIEIMNFNINTSFLKYFSIILCLLYVINQYLKNKLNYLYVLSFLFIIVADYFLLFTNNYFIGVIFFCLVQGCYYKITKGNISIKIFLILSLLGLLISGDSLISVGILYAICSINNLYLSYLSYKNNYYKKDLYMFLGILLLLLCDINLALSYLTNLNTQILVWAFYLPSQLIIITSGLSSLVD